MDLSAAILEYGVSRAAYFLFALITSRCINVRYMCYACRCTCSAAAQPLRPRQGAGGRLSTACVPTWPCVCQCADWRLHDYVTDLRVPLVPLLPKVCVCVCICLWPSHYDLHMSDTFYACLFAWGLFQVLLGVTGESGWP